MILQALSTGASCLRCFRQDARRLPVPVASNPAAGGDPSGAFDPLAVIGRGEIERSGQQSPGVRQEPAPQRLPATVAVERQALSIRALSGRVRRATVPLAVAGGPVHTRAGWAWCAVAGLLLLLTTLATAPAHAQEAGICGRTVEVRDAIVALIPDVDNCADVTADHLGANRHAVAERQRRHLPCGGGFRRADRAVEAGFVEERADGASRRGVRWADLVVEAFGDV